MWNKGNIASGRDVEEICVCLKWINMSWYEKLPNCAADPLFRVPSIAEFTKVFLLYE